MKQIYYKKGRYDTRVRQTKYITNTTCSDKNVNNTANTADHRNTAQTEEPNGG